MIERSAALNIVIASIQEVFAQTGVDAPAALTEDTVLVGKDAVLDSLGVVSLIVEVEQRVEGEHQIEVELRQSRRIHRGLLAGTGLRSARIQAVDPPDQKNRFP